MALSLQRLTTITLLFFAALFANGCVPNNSTPWDTSYSSGSSSTRQNPNVVVNPNVTPQDAQASQIGTTKIGFTVPLTGKGADVGTSLLNGAQLAIFDLNVENVELMPLDTKGTRSGAYEAAKEAYARGADIVLGPLFAEDVKAIRPLTSSARPAIGFTTDWTAANQSTFVMGFLPHIQVERILSYEARRGKNNFAFIVPSNEYGRLISSAGQRLLKAYNLPSAKVVNSPQELITAMQSGSTFDSILVAFAAPEASQIVSSIKGATSQNPQILGTGLWQEKTAVNYPALNGALYAASSGRAKAGFEGNYRRNFGKTPATLSALGYDATALVVSLARKGLKPNSQNLTNPNGFNGLDGAFRFRANGLIDRSLAVIQMNNGRRNVVEEGQSSIANRVN